MIRSDFLRRVLYFRVLGTPDLQEIYAIGISPFHLLREYLALLLSGRVRLWRAVALLELARFCSLHRSRMSIWGFVFIHRLLFPQRSRQQSLRYLAVINMSNSYIDPLDEVLREMEEK